LQVLRRETRDGSNLVRVDPIKHNRSFDGQAVARDLSGEPEEHLECPSRTAVIHSREEPLLQAAAPAHRHRPSCHASHQRRDESEHVAGYRLSIDVHLKAITLERKPDYFLQVVEGILHVNILGALLSSILIDVEDVTGMPALANLFHQQLGLNGPAANRRRIIADLEDLESSELLQHVIAPGFRMLGRNPEDLRLRERHELT